MANESRAGQPAPEAGRRRGSSEASSEKHPKIVCGRRPAPPIWGLLPIPEWINLLVEASGVTGAYASAARSLASFGDGLSPRSFIPSRAIAARFPTRPKPLHRVESRNDGPSDNV